MHYTRISADCHIDLPWIPPDLFTSNASAAMKDRMPYVTDGPDGPHWTCRNGGSFGLVNGVGPAGAKYVPGSHYRVDVMASTGPLRGRQEGRSAGPPIPHLRVKDMDRDGVDAEVIYGILGAATRLNDARGGQRDVPHLQRLAGRLLQPLPRPLHRSGLPALRRHRRRGQGDPSRGEARASRHGAVVLVGHGAHVASGLGATLEGGERREPAAPLPHVPGAAARQARHAEGAHPPRGAFSPWSPASR